MADNSSHRDQEDEGVTPSERRLAALAKGSFLRFWTYGNPAKDQTAGKHNPEGKELCDFLVVFENNVIVFSDRFCGSLVDQDDISKSWNRWFRKSIEKTRGILKAGKWIVNHSDRVFTDTKCNSRIDLAIDTSKKINVHHIVCVHEVKSASIKHIGDKSSGILITPPLYSKINGGHAPFYIECAENRDNFIHYIDDDGLTSLFDEFTTITDFLDYLTKKEQYIYSSYFKGPIREEDLIAQYISDISLQRLDSLQGPGYDNPESTSLRLASLKSTDGYLRRQELVQKSKIIDILIDYLWSNKLNYVLASTDGSISDSVDMVRSCLGFARLSREFRIVLSNNLQIKLEKSTESRMQLCSLFVANVDNPFFVTIGIHSLDRQASDDKEVAWDSDAIMNFGIYLSARAHTFLYQKDEAVSCFYFGFASYNKKIIFPTLTSGCVYRTETSDDDLQKYVALSNDLGLFLDTVGGLNESRYQPYPNADNNYFMSNFGIKFTSSKK